MDKDSLLFCVIDSSLNTDILFIIPDSGGSVKY